LLAGLPHSGDQRHTRPVGQESVRGTVEHHRVSAGSDAQAADVGAPQRVLTPAR
jgi:hypothetical protein